MTKQIILPFGRLMDVVAEETFFTLGWYRNYANQYLHVIAARSIIPIIRDDILDITWSNINANFWSLSFEISSFYADAFNTA